MSNVPPEIDGLLNSGNTKFMLVKGDAGVGKTMFVVEIIKEYGGLYVSTIVTPERLYRDCPGLEENIPPDFILDATHYTTHTHRLLKNLKEDIDDSILKEILFESDSGGKRGTLPPLFQEVDEKIEMAQLPFCLVIDSWDSIFSLASFPKDDEGKEHWMRDEVMKAVLNRFRNKNVNLVMVAEGSHETHLDYLVDGIVELKMNNQSGRTVRSIKVQKIRGAEIKYPEYIFTLFNGHFRYFDPEPEPLQTKNLKKWKPIDGPDGYFSTGNSDLDRLLGGGMPKGSTALIEIGNDVPYEIYSTLIKGATANFLGQGRSVMVVPIGGMDLNDFENTLYKYVGKEVFNEHLRIMERADAEGARDKPYVIPIRFEDITHDLREWMRVYTRLRSKTGNPNLEIIGMDTQEARYGEDVYKEIISVSGEMAKREGNLILRFTRPGAEGITQRGINVSDIHLRLEERNGVTLLYGLKPATRMFVAEPVMVSGNIHLSLQPLV
jgi:KaiC/GvpD/RAD55 family RecA-like ATPase